MPTVDYVVEGLGGANRDKLDAELRAGIDNYTGYSIRNGTGVLHFTNGEQTDFDAADAIIAAHDPTEKTAEQQARADLIGVAQSAVGQSYTALTVDQLKALLAALLWQSGGLANDLTVKPLNEWLRD